MGVFIALVKKDIKLVFADVKAVVMMIFVPFLFIALFSGVADSLMEDAHFIKPFDIAVADKEDSVMTRILIEQLKGTGMFSNLITADEDTCRRMVSGNEVAAAVVIPEDFTSSIDMGENKPVEVIGNLKQSFRARIVYNIIDSASTLVCAGQASMNTVYHYDKEAGIRNRELWDRFQETADQMLRFAVTRRSFFAETAGVRVFDVTPGEYMTAALLSVFLMFTGLPVARIQIYERVSGVHARILTPMAGNLRILASKTVVTFFAGGIQFMVVFAASWFFLGNYWRGSISAALQITLAVLFSVSCWAVLVASVSSTPAAADMTGSLGILLMAAAGGSIYPLHRMPEAVRYISGITVNRWAMEGYMSVFSSTGGVDTSRYVLYIAGVGALMLAVSLLAEAVRAYRQGRGVVL